MKAKGFAVLLVFVLISACAFASDITKDAAGTTVSAYAPDAAAVYTVTFKKDSLAISDDSGSKRDEIIKAIGACLDNGKTPSIRINGYADSHGTVLHNITLSLTRAEAMRDFILGQYGEKGLKKSDFSVNGLGAVDFVGDNSTDEGRSKNRRIELTITGMSSKANADAVAVTDAQAKQEDAKKTEPAKENNGAAGNNGICWGCVSLLVVDAGLVAYTVYAVSDQWKAADNYNTNYGKLNNAQGSNYDKLVSMKKTVDDKKTPVVVGSCLAGAAIAYTAADFFWLHIIFPADVKAGPVISNGSIAGVMLTAKEAF